MPSLFVSQHLIPNSGKDIPQPFPASEAGLQKRCFAPLTVYGVGAGGGVKQTPFTRIWYESVCVIGATASQVYVARIVLIRNSGEPEVKKRDSLSLTPTDWHEHRRW